MIARISIVLFVISIFWSCFNTNSNLSNSEKAKYSVIDLDGIYIYEYLDCNKTGTYWFHSSKFLDKFDEEYNILIGNPDYLLEQCQNKKLKRIIQSYKNKNQIRKSLKLSPQFTNLKIRSKSKNFVPHPFVHYGGDIFDKEGVDTYKVISFRLKGKAIKAEGVCNSYLSYLKVGGCPCPPGNIESTFLLLLDYDLITSLSEREISKLKLVESRIDTFPAIRCD